MFSSIPAFRGELADRLRSVLPETWAIEEDLSAPDNTLTPAVYLEFDTIASTFNGKPIPHGSVAAETNVILTDPRTDRGGEKGVEEHLVTLIGALDEHTDLHWDSARKQKIDRSGVYSWALRLIAFVSTTETTQE
jgi:hypothetical protein